MGKTFQTPKEKQLSFEEVVQKYENTVKKLSINIQDIKPNHILCTLVKLDTPTLGEDGKALIMPGNEIGKDEVVLEVVMVGKITNQDNFDLIAGDRVIVKDAALLLFKPTTKLSCGNLEFPIFHLINSYDVLCKVTYNKI